MLIIFGGLPSSGKSTLSLYLAKRINAVHIRIDSIEQALKDFGNMAQLDVQGYVAGYAVAQDNLRLGHVVVAESVNPIQATRDTWREVGSSAAADIVEVEVVCSDVTEHQTRYEARVSDIPGLRYQPWTAVLEREYDIWESADVRIDTSGKTERESCQDLVAALMKYIPQLAIETAP